MLRKFNFCCKSVGLSCFSFCIGMVAGMCLPLGFVALIEAVMIFLMGYLCLFKW